MFALSDRSGGYGFFSLTKQAEEYYAGDQVEVLILKRTNFCAKPRRKLPAAR